MQVVNTVKSKELVHKEGIIPAEHGPFYKFTSFIRPREFLIGNGLLHIKIEEPNGRHSSHY